MRLCIALEDVEPKQVSWECVCYHQTSVGGHSGGKWGVRRECNFEIMFSFLNCMP